MRNLSLLLSLLGLGACVATTPSGAPPKSAPEEEAPPGISTDQDAEKLALQLSNPIASLTSVPLQFNFDQDIGPGDGERFLLNVQPVIPVALTEDWNLISRTILPVIDQTDVPPGNDEFGLGDVVQSLFFSPVKPTERGWIWGVGPALLLPTATDDTLGAEKWGLGPTFVALKQEGPWTYGGLMNHIWSVAGDDGRADVNATFLQPFLTYTTPTAWTYALNAEATYDWEGDELGLPLNLIANKVLNLGGQLIQLGGGLRYWVEETDGGPEGVALRLNLVFLFPKK